MKNLPEKVIKMTVLQKWKIVKVELSSFYETL